MGTLTLPTSGLVYLDANSVIYTVEKHPLYGPLLQPLWLAAQAGIILSLAPHIDARAEQDRP